MFAYHSIVMVAFLLLFVVFSCAHTGGHEQTPPVKTWRLFLLQNLGCCESLDVEDRILYHTGGVYTQ